MKQQFAILLAVLSICAGCAKSEMERTTGQDAVIMVKRYKEASIARVATVLNEYLTLTDDYEKRGWEKYGRPGWIEHLRAVCEGRLAVFYKATGKRELYRQHMDLAIAHLKKESRGREFTDEQIIALIEGADSKNIDPNWRKEIGQQISSANGASPRR